MATLNTLKQALRQKVNMTSTSPRQPLSDQEYSAGFDILVRGSGWMTYQDFIIPQLSELVTLLLNSRNHISALEIGPGPVSVLGHLPNYLRQKVRKYTAFEPNGLFATRLEEWLCSTSEIESPLPCLETLPVIHRNPFVRPNNGTNSSTNDIEEKYDLVLFCHSMYGMKPKHKFIEQALKMLIEQPQGGLVVIFHRNAAINLDGLVCHRTATSVTGCVSVANNDKALDIFASFIMGLVVEYGEVNTAVQFDLRKVCRNLGYSGDDFPDHLLFKSPNVMVAFNQHATMLPELTTKVPMVTGDNKVKSWEARIHGAASIVRPEEIGHVQQCVQWALRHRVSLTVIGGGHSGHCLWPNVVAVDMSAFDKVQILTAGLHGGDSPNCEPLIVAEAGCKTGDIILKTMEVGLTVPLGSRPSVGAGLWLQGGIGHLARLHGLACDAIIGAVVVNVTSSQILCIGEVPKQHWPVGAVRPDNEADLLWALKGAGTNFGIVISVTFKAYAAPTFAIRSWIIPVRDNQAAHHWLGKFDSLVNRNLPLNCSADVYLYWDTDQLHFGVTMFESSMATSNPETSTPMPLSTFLGPEQNLKVVDSVGLFATEMYMSGMHGGHGGGKTSSFKRCVFLKHIGAMQIADILLAAIETRPSPFCYLHLIQGGGAVRDVPANHTAFGCRDWDFACVVTGVWLRNQDESQAARSAVQWVYDVVGTLLPLNSGVYGADLGPDPRDADLAAKAFGPNRPRLSRLKYNMDPRNILAYTCPLPKPPIEPKLIIFVTGKSCAGKDYCANVWISVLNKSTDQNLTVRAVSISDAIKRQYAEATGADLNRLFGDRTYKEQHRPALTTFFHEQERERPSLPVEHFLNVVHDAQDVDVLIITGMRDDAPVTTLSHLVSGSKVLDIHVQASKETREIRRGCQGGDSGGKVNKDGKKSTASDYCPSLIFDNDSVGDEAAERFAENYLLPLLHKDLQRLANMVRQVSDFPRPGIDFRHVLDISQQPGGLALSTSLLHTHFYGDWTQIDAIVCCEAGGLVFASALALRVDVPLVLIREAGKLPPPTFSVEKPSSYIFSLGSKTSKEKRIEMERDVLPKGASVVVVDDVFSTGETLCALILLLGKAGINVEDISIMVVAEFPLHCGRERLRQRGFGRINIQSLLVFGGT